MVLREGERVEKMKRQSPILTNSIIVVCILLICIVMINKIDDFINSIMKYVIGGL